MPNAFAYVALFLWPVVVFFLFARRPSNEALAWSILGGYLLLPFGVGINLPVLPTIDKTLIPSVAAALFGLLTAPRDNQRAPDSSGQRPAGAPYQGQPREELLPLHRPRLPGIVEVSLIALMLATPIATVLSNAEVNRVGLKVLPGLGLYDAGALILASIVALLPYLLARRFLADAAGQLVLLRCLALAGVFYTIPTLFEVRMSPQLSKWTYGFLSQSFDQAIRDGGFRPVVFLEHGLWLAIFLAMSALSATAVWRIVRGWNRWLFAALWLLLTLAISRSLGGLVIALLMTIIVVSGSPRARFLFAALIGIIVLGYPILRSSDYFPRQTITDVVRNVSVERADSLDFRFGNEQLLLERAQAKPIAGWGGWGRSRVFDPISGADISTIDGMWIITLGTSGWMGFIGTFGLLAAPLLLCLSRRGPNSQSLATSGLCVVLAANLIDLIPNGTLTPITWMVAGSLMGGLQRVTQRDEAPPPRTGDSYRPIAETRAGFNRTASLRAAPPKAGA